MRRLNFGSGSIRVPGWDNLDFDPQFDRDFSFSTQVPDGEYDYIVAHCSIQVNSFNELRSLFNELFRMLRVGGVIRISLPDIIGGFKAYESNDKEFFPNGEDDLDIRFSAWLTWYSTSKSLLTMYALKRFLKDAGFTQIEKVNFRQSKHEGLADLDTRENECYFVEAIK